MNGKPLKRHIYQLFDDIRRVLGAHLSLRAALFIDSLNQSPCTKRGATPHLLARSRQKRRGSFRSRKTPTFVMTIAYLVIAITACCIANEHDTPQSEVGLRRTLVFRLVKGSQHRGDNSEVSATQVMILKGPRGAGLNS